MTLAVGSPTRTLDLTSILPELPGTGGIDEILPTLKRPDISAGSTPERAISIINPEDIPVSRQRADGHFLSAVISSPHPVTLADIAAVRSKVRFTNQVPASGAIPAGTIPGSHYEGHLWVRDLSIVAHACSQIPDSAHQALGAKAMRHIASVYSVPIQRGKWTSFLFNPDPHAKYAGAHVLEYPPIFLDIDSKGKAVPSQRDWCQSQLDAIGAWHWATFRMANDGLLDLPRLNSGLTRFINRENEHESLFAVSLRVMNRIRFWDQSDHGIWEAHKLFRRASSVGAVLSGLHQAHQFFTQHGWGALNGPGQVFTAQTEVEDAIAKGTDALATRIFTDGRPAMESEEIKSDSALAVLLALYDPKLTAGQADSILRMLYERDGQGKFRRMGEVGFSRWDGDPYLGSDHATFESEDGVWSDSSHPNFREAQWTLMDPLLASFHFERYIDSNGADLNSYLLADRHFKRAVAHITSGNEEYTKRTEKVVTIMPGRLPEAFWLDTKQDTWRANENTPLLMAEAMFALMLARGKKAAQVYEALAKAA